MKTLLLAESHAQTLAHLQDALKLAGYAVHAVSDPGIALEFFVAQRPDAVLVAVDLPRLDGSHLARRLRATDAGPRAPLVVIDKGHLGKAKGVGAVLGLEVDAYVADPLKGGELVQKLQSLLSAPAPTPEGGIARTLARPAVAAGDLRGHPLPPLLESLHRQRQSGILVLASRDRVRRLYLREGGGVGFDSNAPGDGFESFLVEHNRLSASQAERVQAALKEGMRFAAALEDAGASLEGEELLQARRDFVRERAAQVLEMRQGRFAFYPGDEYLPEVIAVETPSLAPILDGARRAQPFRSFLQTLQPHLDAYPRRSEAFGKALPALALDTEDLKIALQMNGRIALRVLLTHGRGDLRRATSLAWFLALAGLLELSREPRAEGGNREPEMLPPRKLKPLPAETAAELRDAAVRILASSYFGVLGVPITAEEQQVERAFRDVAPRFHPDSYPEHDTSEIQDLLDSVQEKITAAYRVLSSAEKRRGYLQHLLSRLELPRATPVNVDAELALKRGEAALKRGDARSAVLAFEQAISLCPREPEFHSHLAWASFLGGGASEERARAAQKPLRKALGLNPTLERAQVLAAIIDFEAGDSSTARKRLLRVLELNPSSKVAKAALRRVNR